MVGYGYGYGSEFELLRWEGRVGRVGRGGGVRGEGVKKTTNGDIH